MLYYFVLSIISHDSRKLNLQLMKALGYLILKVVWLPICFYASIYLLRFQPFHFTHCQQVFKHSKDNREAAHMRNSCSLMSPRLSHFTLFFSLKIYRSIFGSRLCDSTRVTRLRRRTQKKKKRTFAYFRRKTFSTKHFYL